MYLDPGLGSMIIQIIIAGAAAVGAVFFALKGRIRAFFGKKPVDSDAENDTQADNTEQAVETSADEAAPKAEDTDKT